MTCTAPVTRPKLRNFPPDFLIVSNLRFNPIPAKFTTPKNPEICLAPLVIKLGNGIKLLTNSKTTNAMMNQGILTPLLLMFVTESSFFLCHFSKN